MNDFECLADRALGYCGDNSRENVAAHIQTSLPVRDGPRAVHSLLIITPSWGCPAAAGAGCCFVFNGLTVLLFF